MSQTVLKEWIHSFALMLDPGLWLEGQVSSLASNIFNQLQTFQVQLLLKKCDLATEIHALIISTLDHYNALYMTLLQETLSN